MFVCMQKPLSATLERWILEIYKRLTLAGCCQDADSYCQTLFIASKNPQRKVECIDAFSNGINQV